RRLVHHSSWAEFEQGQVHCRSVYGGWFHLLGFLLCLHTPLGLAARCIALPPPRCGAGAPWLRIAVAIRTHRPRPPGPACEHICRRYGQYAELEGRTAIRPAVPAMPGIVASPAQES